MSGETKALLLQRKKVFIREHSKRTIVKDQPPRLMVTNQDNPDNSTTTNVARRRQIKKGSQKTQESAVVRDSRISQREQRSIDRVKQDVEKVKGRLQGLRSQRSKQREKVNELTKEIEGGKQKILRNTSGALAGEAARKFTQLQKREPELLKAKQRLQNITREIGQEIDVLQQEQQRLVDTRARAKGRRAPSDAAARPDLTQADFERKRLARTQAKSKREAQRIEERLKTGAENIDPFTGERRATEGEVKFARRRGRRKARSELTDRVKEEVGPEATIQNVTVTQFAEAVRQNEIKRKERERETQQALAQPTKGQQDLFSDFVRTQETAPGRDEVRPSRPLPGGLKGFVARQVRGAAESQQRIETGRETFFDRPKAIGQATLGVIASAPLAFTKEGVKSQIELGKRVLDEPFAVGKELGDFLRTQPERSVGRIGGLVVTAKIGGKIIQSQPFRFSKFELPQGTGRATTVRTFGVQAKGRAQPLLSFTRTGQQTFPRVSVGTPNIRQSLRGLPEGGQGLKPATALETSIVKRNVKRLSGTDPRKALRRERAIDVGQNLIRETEGTPAVVEGLPKVTKRLDETGTDVLLKLAREEEATVFGSFARRAQIGDDIDDFVPKDIDIRVADASPENIQRLRQEAVKRLQRRGIESRLSPDKADAIDVRLDDGNFIKAAEFKGAGFIDDDTVPDLVLGFEKEGKPIRVEGLKLTPLEEELRGVTQGVLRVRKVDGEVDVFPPSNRFKDIRSTVISAEALRRSQEGFGSSALRDFLQPDPILRGPRPDTSKLARNIDEFRFLFQEGLDDAPGSVLLADFSKSTSPGSQGSKVPIVSTLPEDLSETGRVLQKDVSSPSPNNLLESQKGGSPLTSPKTGSSDVLKQLRGVKSPAVSPRDKSRSPSPRVTITDPSPQNIISPSEKKRGSPSPTIKSPNLPSVVTSPPSPPTSPLTTPGIPKAGPGPSSPSPPPRSVNRPPESKRRFGLKLDIDKAPQLFNVEVGQFGNEIFKQFKNVPLSKVKQSVRQVRTGLAASIKVKSAGPTNVKQSKIAELLGSDFRRSKVDPERFVELRGKRLSTKSEVVDIQRFKDRALNFKVPKVLR